MPSVIGPRPAPLLDAALDALSAHVAVLDTKRVVSRSIKRGADFGIGKGLKLANSAIGTNYLAVIARAGCAASSVFDHTAVLRRPCLHTTIIKNRRQRVGGLREEAAHAHSTRTTHTANYLLGMPLVSDYLEEGLSLFGLSCDDFEINRL